MRSEIEVKTGDRYNRWVIIKESAPLYFKNHKIRIFECKCDCGTISLIRLRTLRNNTSKSCGCLQKEILTEIVSSHKQSWNKNRSSEYNCWLNIKQRCSNPKSTSWKYYGAKGIKMCEKWLNSFESFFEDMGKKPSKMYSIDRINNNGNYEPNNCRWATKSEQRINQNKRKRTIS